MAARVTSPIATYLIDFPGQVEGALDCIWLTLLYLRTRFDELSPYQHKQTRQKNPRLHDELEWDHYSDVTMSGMASEITGISTVCPTVCSGAHQRQHQSSASLPFVRGIHRWPMDSPHTGPISQNLFPFDNVIMFTCFIETEPVSIGLKGQSLQWHHMYVMASQITSHSTLCSATCLDWQQKKRQSPALLIIWEGKQ